MPKESSSIIVGQAVVTPIFEADGGSVIEESLPMATPEKVQKIGWLRPHYLEEDGRLKANLQALLVQVGGKNFLIDPGVGDGKNLQDIPAWANMHTSFMKGLSALCPADKIDFVICTHMHCDHVGWNTVLQGGKWQPTFPNAQYIFSETEFNYWETEPQNELADDRAGFAAAVLPVYEAGLARLVPDDYRVTPEVLLIPTPGHTPGHVSILIESGGQQAVVSGDILHHPCQLARPEWGTPYDTDTERAAKSRTMLLERFADTGAIFIGSHFAEPIAGKLIRDDKGYKLVV